MTSKSRNFLLKFLMWYGILMGGLFGIPLIIWGIWSAVDPKIMNGPGITLPFDVLWIPIIIFVPFVLCFLVLIVDALATLKNLQK